MTKNPNAILRSIRSSMATLGQGSPAATPPPVHDLIQAIKDLDNHLSWGGIPPDEWRSAPFALPPARVSDTRAHQIRVLETPAPEPDPVEDIIRRM
ncbi:MAG: hypothetical protein M3Y73_17220 [Actinomycetota bacterium]|nr:hypothetical protein [Actinomycetota bacterium]